MKQVLSVEQMKHLQELGLDTGDASMHWQYYLLPMLLSMEQMKQRKSLLSSFLNRI